MSFVDYNKALVMKMEENNMLQEEEFIDNEPLPGQITLEELMPKPEFPR